MKIRSLLLAALLLAVPMAGAADLRGQARDGAAEVGDAVVIVELVQSIKFNMRGQSQEREEKARGIATIIDETGLAVASLSSIDQSIIARRVYGDREDFSFEMTVKDAKYILPDSSEVPATVVLRDPDLDLAFLRPQKKGDRTWTHVSLSDDAEAAMLDEVYALARMGRIARRTVSVMTGEVQAIVTRPRTWYVASFVGSNAQMGMPVFTSDGKVLGIALYHSVPGSPDSDDTSENVLPVVLPAADIAEIAAQAPQEAAPEPVTEEPVAEEEEEGDAEE